MKHYLGDGVYIAIQKYEDKRYNEIILTTENGISTTNRIVMEPAVLENFLEYIKRNIPK